MTFRLMDKDWGNDTFSGNNLRKAVNAKNQNPAH